MIKKVISPKRGLILVKTAATILTSVLLASALQFSACSAADWTFWEEETAVKEDSEYACVTTVYKGQKEQFLNMGEAAGEVTWNIEKPEILEIGENGELRPLKVGNTLVTVTVKQDKVVTDSAISASFAAVTSSTGDKIYQYYISVCKKKAYKAVKKARKAIGTAYSQEKRMEEGFYDCSSLIWRSYSPYGITLGMENWAPTAADQAFWCEQNQKKIAEKPLELSKGKLLPGDLIFISGETDNGRYKKIYHVAMFEGYQMNYNEWTGEYELSATMIEANGKSVVRNTYRAESFHSRRMVTLIARPTK